jgi:uncharacterized protein (TIGR03083 family)
MSDLVFHLGQVHRFWANTIIAASPDQRPEENWVDVDDAELATWATTQCENLIDAISSHSEGPCWTWWGEPATTAAVARHQVFEATLHGWDGVNAANERYVINPALALDGIQEFLEVMTPSIGVPQDYRIVLNATDGGAPISFGSPTSPSVTLTADASTLLLMLFHRVDLESVVIEGDRQLAESWLALADLT